MKIHSIFCDVIHYKSYPKRDKASENLSLKEFIEQNEVEEAAPFAQMLISNENDSGVWAAIVSPSGKNTFCLITDEPIVDQPDMPNANCVTDVSYFSDPKSNKNIFFGDMSKAQVYLPDLDGETNFPAPLVFDGLIEPDESDDDSAFSWRLYCSSSFQGKILADGELYGSRCLEYYPSVSAACRSRYFNHFVFLEAMMDRAFLSGIDYNSFCSRLNKMTESFNIKLGKTDSEAYQPVRVTRNYVHNSGDSDDGFPLTLSMGFSSLSHELYYSMTEEFQESVYEEDVRKRLEIIDRSKNRRIDYRKEMLSRLEELRHALEERSVTGFSPRKNNGSISDKTEADVENDGEEDLAASELISAEEPDAEPLANETEPLIEFETVSEERPDSDDAQADDEDTRLEGKTVIVGRKESYQAWNSLEDIIGEPVYPIFCEMQQHLKDKLKDALLAEMVSGEGKLSPEDIKHYVELLSQL